MLKAMPHREGWLFPGNGRKPGPLTIAATLKLLKELRPGLTAHGFRSTFRDWAADQTGYPRDVAEMALAHTIKDKSEAAYRRSDMLERRARLMQDWATYCGIVPVESDNVTPIRRRKA
jgi:integrase